MAGRGTPFVDKGTRIVSSDALGVSPDTRAAAGRPLRLRDPLRLSMVVGLHAASQFWFLSMLARYCDAAQVGDYVLGFSISAPLVLFASFRLRIVLASDRSAVDPTWHLVRFRMLTCLLVTAVMAGAAITLFGMQPAAAIVGLVGGIKAVEALSDICYGGLTRLGFGARAESSIVRRALLSALATTIVIVLTHDVLWALSTLLCCWAAGAAFDVWQLYRLNPPVPNTQAAPKTLALAGRYLPLGLAALLTSVAFNLPRYFIGAYDASSQLAYYGVAAYFGQLTLMLANAATESLLPGITQSHAGALRDGRYLKAIRRVYRLIAAGGAASLILGTLVGRPILRAFFGIDYAAHLDVLLIVQLACVFGALSICQVHVVIALGAYREQMIVALCSFVIIAAASYGLVPRFGIVGAAWADVIYAAVFFTWTEWNVHRHA